MKKKSQYKEIAESFVEKPKKSVPPLNIAIPVESRDYRFSEPLATTVDFDSNDLNVEFRCGGCGDKVRSRESKLNSFDLPSGWGIVGDIDLCDKCMTKRIKNESILETYHSANIQYAMCDDCGKKEKNLKVNLDPKTKLPKGWGHGLHGRGTDLCKDCFAKHLRVVGGGQWGDDEDDFIVHKDNK